MKEATFNLMSLADASPELAEAVKNDIERIVAEYIKAQLPKISEAVVTQQAYHLERLALRSLKNHLNSSSSIY